MNANMDYNDADTISINTLMLENMLRDDRIKEMTKLKTLAKTVCNLHTNILYYRNASTKRGAVCYEAWKSLIKTIGGSPNTWRELGYALGVSPSDLNYIENSVKEDAPADIVIKVYMQNESATLDKIVEALEKMKRYDVLKAIEEPFCNMSQYFNKKDDSGYQSESKPPGTGNKIIYSANEIVNDLPAALNKNYVIKDKEPKPNQPTQPLRQPLAEFDEVEDDGPLLFLTYTEDGLDTAINIQHYINDWEGQKVTVLTLCNRKDQVYQNPEKFIRKYFEKADFIVPIITTGYLKSINPLSPHVPSTNDNLDYKYVNFIYNLIINHYIHATGCLNNKVRSVLPFGVNINVLKEINMYPDLLPFTYESNFNEHFKAFLKKHSVK
ncbi:uncharacterized protein LOC120628665 [Pararge aegeria]|uniref:Tumor necrosis factor receptor superfamily member 16 n=1 Tax=Pararge aegeria TaxID=116150 RepID=S4PV42_9NEOP|nr:uncharacterized protein LOC120628665 [Pararge aegeria]